MILNQQNMRLHAWVFFNLYTRSIWQRTDNHTIPCCLLRKSVKGMLYIIKILRQNKSFHINTLLTFWIRNYTEKYIYIYTYIYISCVMLNVILEERNMTRSYIQDDARNVIPFTVHITHFYFYKTIWHLVHN